MAMPTPHPIILPVGPIPIDPLDRKESLSPGPRVTIRE